MKKFQGLRPRVFDTGLLPKIQEDRHPNILDYMRRDEIALILNTPSTRGPITDEAQIRHEAVLRGVPVITTIAGALAAVEGIESLKTASGWCDEPRRSSC